MSLSLILSGRHRIQKVYNYVDFLDCTQALASGQPLIHVCLCFVLLCFHFWPCLQLLTDKLVRQCKWVWPARLGEGRGRGNQQNPVPGPTIPHTLLLRNIFFFNCANRSQWFLFFFFSQVSQRFVQTSNNG